MVIWRIPRSGPRGGCLFATLGLASLFIVLSLISLSLAWGTELVLRPRANGAVDSDISKFGRYGDAYYQRRWRRMCLGAARYDAMREADELGKPNPC